MQELSRPPARLTSERHCLLDSPLTVRIKGFLGRTSARSTCFQRSGHIPELGRNSPTLWTIGNN